jgi:uncharacterized protein (TIGR02449 family)
MTSKTLETIEQKVDILLQMYHHLEMENKQLLTDRTRLLQDNELAREKIDKVMAKLKMLESKFDPT